MTAWLLPLLLPVCLIAPGFFFVRRLAWSPLEKLCAAIGLSCLLLYGATFAIYALDLPHAAYYAVSGACLLLLILCARDLVRLFANHRVRHTLRWFALLFIWCFLLLGLVRHYAGGTWSGDWLEHYQRTRFFLDHGPLNYLFIDLYSLPARPPLMNLLATFFLAHVGPLAEDYKAFEYFQLVFLTLNVLIFFPAALLLPVLFQRAAPAWRLRRATMILACLLALCPLFVENTTYAWTKLFTGFYVLLGLWLYIRGLQRDDPRRIIAAFASLSAGMLVHFSAGPYAAFVLAHYLLRGAWRKRAPASPDRLTAAKRPRILEGLGAGAVCVAILATWFVWSIAHYGLHETFASNTAVTDSAHTGSAADNLAKVAHNIVNTLFPPALRHPVQIMRDADLKQDSLAGTIRDYSFILYQVSLPFAAGSLGALLILYLLIRDLRRHRAPPIPAPPPARATPTPSQPLRTFWFAFILTVIPLGIAVHGGADRYGVAHICLQPLIVLAVAFLAANFFRLPPALRYLALLALALDFSIGIFLHVHLQNRVFKLETNQANEVRVVFPPGEGLSHGAQYNWFTKTREELVFWGDLLIDFPLVIETLLGIGAAAFLWRLARSPALPAPRASRRRSPSKSPPTRVSARARSRQ